MKKTQSIIFLLLMCMRSVAQLPEYGLHIQSYPLQNSEFTSMVLENSGHWRCSTPHSKRSEA